jgi:hypothetical protein
MPERNTNAARGAADKPGTASDPVGLMTTAQASDLKRLSEDARELEAFSAKLTEAEAAVRINALKAKLRLQDEPPHTL